MAVLNLSEKQAVFLAHHGVVFDFAAMSEDDLAQLEEDLGNLLMREGLDDAYDDNAVGRQVREIMDLLDD
ncbi:MAG: hypothetical protein RBS78_05460 [Coriobacteriia bacterium]|nr:hypothetical protein [Coriobacteriia bacterium]